MKKRLLLWLGLLFPLTAGAFTFNSDGSQSSVQSCINSASAGDTVSIPSGSFGWSSSVTMAKAIRLKGQGSGAIVGWSRTSNTFGTGTKTFTVQSGFNVGTTIPLRIWVMSTDKTGSYMLGKVTSISGTTATFNITTNTGGSATGKYWLIATEYATRIVHNAGSSTLLSVTETTDTSHRPTVTGIQFTSGTGTGHTIEMIGATGGQPICIKACWFNQTNDGADVNGVSGTILSQSSRHGIISACSADWTYVTGTDSLWLHCKYDVNTAVWSNPSTMGTNDTDGKQNFYVEGNNFHGAPAVTDFDNNMTAVVRDNVFDHGAFNSHGYDTSPYGVRHWEIYDNTFLFADLGADTMNLNQYMVCRGGTGVITGNSFQDISSGAYGDPVEINFAVYALENWAYDTLDMYGEWSSHDGGVPQYPAPRQFGYGYIDGSGVDGQGEHTSNGVKVGDLEPTYVWNNSSSGFTPVIGIGGCGCGGVQSDNPADYVHSGRDYYADGTAKPSWTRYTYPHPLASGGFPN